MKAVKNLKVKSGQIFRKILHGKDGEAHHHGFAIPSEIQNIFREYAEGHATISETGLQRFLEDCQKERPEAIVVGDVSSFDEEHFLKYLLDPMINLAINTQIHQDMTKPLANYFIWTGHNSYLTGNQLSSDCGVEPIINALKKGVRVIELDIWPDSDGKKISVYHGRTMTKPVKFKDCINAIKEHAFVASDYPLIITLEDHLKPDLQKKAAKRITKTFGDKLYKVNIEEPLRAFPSPEECRGLVLISTKPPVKKEGCSETVPEEDNKKSRQSTRSRPSSSGGRTEWGEELQPAGSERMLSAPPSDSDDDLDEDEEGEVMDRHYLRMISIKGGKISSKDYEKALRDVQVEVQRVSLSEHGLVKVAKLYPEDLVKFTQNNLLRIFPAASRIDSSNYNPILAWLFGAQLVAFNMQGVGRPLWLMDGFFRANGGCGYVLKPEILLSRETAATTTGDRQSWPHPCRVDTPSQLSRETAATTTVDRQSWPHPCRVDTPSQDPDSCPRSFLSLGKPDEDSMKGRPKARSRPVTPTRSFSPSDGESMPAQPLKLILKVRVLMGDGWLEKFARDHFDRFSAPDFYVRVGIAGVEADSGMQKTEVVSNRWHPVWKENEFEFRLTVPEIAVLRFECHDYDDNGRDDFAGQTAYPVSELRQGYRAVPLNDKKGNSLLPVRLLCYFSITKV